MVRLQRLVLCFLVALPGIFARLAVSGRHLTYNGQRVFLSGVNIAWNSYGYDFGNGQYEANSKSILESWLSEIAESGGNSVRIWLHVEGANTPAYDINGYVTGPDRAGTIINDMRAFLDFAQSKNILVFFCLWNGAVLTLQNTINLFYDEGKLSSYIQNALRPMVTALSSHPALGAWEIMNEPEGAVRIFRSHDKPCFDTTVLEFTGAGWTRLRIPMQNILKFVNWHAAAIKGVDGSALVTVGSWSQHSQNDVYHRSRNYYTDACLYEGGGRAEGKLDFYQMHTYSMFGFWSHSAPFKNAGDSYGLDKPLIIGEFSSVCAAGEGIQQLYNHAYTSGYQGAWAWQYNAGGRCSDIQTVQLNGINVLRDLNGTGGLVRFPVQ